MNSKRSFPTTKLVFILYFMTFLGFFSKSAHSFDIKDLSPEEAVEKILGSLKKEPPDLPDLNCPTSTSFSFVKVHWTAQKALDTEKSDICRTVGHYDNFIHGSMQNFWPLNEDFGLEVYWVPDAKTLNGAYVQRPILNKNIAPSLMLFHHPGLNHNLDSPIWAHEYGHAVLGNYIDAFYYPLSKEAMIKEFKIKRNRLSKEPDKDEILYNLQEKLYLERDTLHSEINLIKQDNLKRKNLELKHKQIIAQLSKTNIELAIVENQREEDSNSYYKYLNFLASPYHEFFADVFAGLYFKNINKVGDNFDILEIDMGGSKSDNRRFIPSNKNLANANYWNNYHVHDFFTPARHAFGLMGFNEILKQNKERLFLDKLAQFILAEIKWLRDSAPDYVFNDYIDLKSKIEKTKNAEEIFKVLDEMAEKNKIKRDNIFYDFQNYCTYEFTNCKKTILDQIDLKRKGLFLLSPNIQKSNERLIEVLQTIVEETLN